jgi:hypothetical protein
MSEQTFGQVTVMGTAAQVAFIGRALAVVVNGAPLHDAPRKPYRMEVHTPAEFLQKGLIIPGTEGDRTKTALNPKGGKAAWGYVVGNRVLWVNSRLGPWKMRYTAVHELAHAIDSDYLDADKKAELMNLMDVSPRPWKGGGYAKRPREIYADAFAEAVGIESPLDDFYGDIEDVDLHKVIEITFRPAPPPPVVEEPPDPPLPLPDPVLEAAKERIVELELAMAAIYTVAEKAKPKAMEEPK